MESAAAGNHEHLHEADEEQRLVAFRRHKDEFMREDPHSPLGPEQRAEFNGLSYFPLNLALRCDLALDRDVSVEPITMETSTSGSREYRRAGKVQFEVEGESAVLMIYQGTLGELFLPMRDATSGKESYGAGRYLEPEMTTPDTVLVDFNYLYNPYCAYNEQYSCPLPPLENWLQVPIKAGEKKFRD